MYISSLLNYSSISQSLSHSQAHMLEKSKLNLLHVCGVLLFFFLHSHSHLSLFHFCFELHFLPLNFYLHLHEVCFMNFFIYTFDHSEYFQIYIFHFIGSTYSANWILKRITTSIKPIKTNHQWTVFCDASLNVSDQSSYWSEQVRLLCF